MNPFIGLIALLSQSVILNQPPPLQTPSQAPSSELGEKSNSDSSPPIVKANYVLTSADDFMVEVYQNGKEVPLTKREMLNERFGATTEKINIEVHKGDWLVFHVVNNELRWGGAYYFAVAGSFAPNEFGFVSDAKSGAWSYCDTLKDVEKFITNRGFMKKHSALLPKREWAEGKQHIVSLAGDKWNGTAVWGNAKSTWIKVLVD